MPYEEEDTCTCMHLLRSNLRSKLLTQIRVVPSFLKIRCVCACVYMCVFVLESPGAFHSPDFLPFLAFRVNDHPRYCELILRKLPPWGIFVCVSPSVGRAGRCGGGRGKERRGHAGRGASQHGGANIVKSQCPSTCNRSLLTL